MNVTDTAFEELGAILTKETEAHEQLLDAAGGVNAAIKESDVETLRNRSFILDERIEEVQRIEERRKECCGVLSRDLGMAPGTVRLTHLIEKAPPAFREKLSGLRESLKTSLEKAARITIANRILLEEGLRIVHGRILAVMRPDERFSQYRRRGERAAPGRSFHPFINQTI